ncbi:MAG: hypothetical protein QX190_05345 [Methylococcales bacterium]
MSPLDKIKQAGFNVWLESVDGLEDRLLISQSDKLTAEQLAYLKANKQATINELLITTVYTPNGQVLTVLARDAEHQAFLLRMNPLPKEYQND